MNMVKKCAKDGISRIEVIVILLIAVLFTMFVPFLCTICLPSYGARCSGNLSHLGRALWIYQQHYGNGHYYPPQNGAGFLTSLYQLKITEEYLVYLCPSTPEGYENWEKEHSARASWFYSKPNLGKKLANLHDSDPDGENVIGYAGRKNANQARYPGVGRLFSDKNLTTLASDDWQGTPNHEDGQVVFFLFHDMHVEAVRNSKALGNDYNAYAKGTEQKFQLADPLTN